MNLAPYDARRARIELDEQAFFAAERAEVEHRYRDASPERRAQALADLDDDQPDSSFFEYRGPTRAMRWESELKKREGRHQRRVQVFRERFPLRAVELVLGQTVATVDRNAPAISAIEQLIGGLGITVLAGGVGCGKTTAACWWAWHGNGLGADTLPLFAHAATIANAPRFGEGSERWQGWLEAESLIVDDLGTEAKDVRGTFGSRLDELVNLFYSEQRELLITTNLSAPTFAKRYGARIVDRIRGSGAWINIGGESRRGAVS